MCLCFPALPAFPASPPASSLPALCPGGRPSWSCSALQALGLVPSRGAGNSSLSFRAIAQSPKGTLPSPHCLHCPPSPPLFHPPKRPPSHCGRPPFLSCVTFTFCFSVIHLKVFIFLVWPFLFPCPRPFSPFLFLFLFQISSSATSIAMGSLV